MGSDDICIVLTTHYSLTVSDTLSLKDDGCFFC